MKKFCKKLFRTIDIRWGYKFESFSFFRFIFKGNIRPWYFKKHTKYYRQRSRGNVIEHTDIWARFLIFAVVITIKKTAKWRIFYVTRNHENSGDYVRLNK